MRIIIGALLVCAAATAIAARQATVTPAEYAAWLRGEKTTLPSNWGRWGADDQLGTLNLITPEKRRAAAALVRDGVSVSLAQDADTVSTIDNANPYQILRRPDRLGSDGFSVMFHGQAHTHLDSMAHHFDFDGAAYNGYRPDPEVVLKRGHPRNGIGNVKDGIFTRGILLDIPRLKGVPYLEPGTAITAEDLEAALKAAGLKVMPGDALFIRTGVWAYRAKFGPYARGRAGKNAGLHPSTIRWAPMRDLAAMGSDHPQGANPVEPTQAAHDFPLVALGLHLFDNCDLEALAEAAAARRRWEFLLTVAPLRIVGGTGSPVNPIATF